MTDEQTLKTNKQANRYIKTDKQTYNDRWTDISRKHKTQRQMNRHIRQTNRLIKTDEQTYKDRRTDL